MKEERETRQHTVSTYPINILSTPSITHPHVRFEEAKEQLRSASETNLMDYEYQATSRNHPLPNLPLPLPITIMLYTNPTLSLPCLSKSNPKDGNLFLRLLTLTTPN